MMMELQGVRQLWWWTVDSVEWSQFATGQLSSAVCDRLIGWRVVNEPMTGWRGQCKLDGNCALAVTWRQLADIIRFALRDQRHEGLGLSATT